jgi:arsenate reductase
MRPYRVLFVCIGNACRSQMAEAFARAYGDGVLIPASAGVYPAGIVSPVTVRLMREKNISLDSHWSKGLKEAGVQFDLVINMSQEPLPKGITAPVRQWAVEDPIGSPDERHREVRDRIERLVRNLIRELRAGAEARM